MPEATENKGKPKAAGSPKQAPPSAETSPSSSSMAVAVPPEAPVDAFVPSFRHKFAAGIMVAVGGVWTAVAVATQELIPGALAVLFLAPGLTVSVKYVLAGRVAAAPVAVAAPASPASGEGSSK